MISVKFQFGKLLVELGMSLTGWIDVQPGVVESTTNVTKHFYVLHVAI